jgi:hypothetical protein
MHVQVIHFTVGATDPVQGFQSHGVRSVALADGAGADETYVSCLHFEPGGWIIDPPTVRDSALLLVHGAATFFSMETGLRLELSPGLGLTLNADDRYRLMSETGAIILVVESERLEATDAGKSTPERIWGAKWPGEVVVRGRRTLLSVMRWICFRVRWWPTYRRMVSVAASGWLVGIGEESEGERLRAERERGRR